MKIKRKIYFLFFIALYISTLSGYAQTTAFPYNIGITTIPGNCYDDCRIIINMYDAAGNEILVDPQTHNAQNTTLYPLYNIEYNYRNVSAGTNTQYDTLNNIQVLAGTYCIGVTAFVPVTLPNGQTDYELVDTMVYNVEVVAIYEHLEGYILSTMARNNYEAWWGEGVPREFCGCRPSFQCADRGRIQLKLLNGKFPYKVLILDAFQDTIRQVTFWQRQQSGMDSVFADYQDYYTFDNMPIGNYSIRVSDSCDYTLWFSIEIPSAEPYNSNLFACDYSISQDTMALQFLLKIMSFQTVHDYDASYLDSIIQYRFINPGGDTTVWYPHITNLWDPTSYILIDTLSQINSYCDLYNDTVIFQFRNLCLDTISSTKVYYKKGFNFSDQLSCAFRDPLTYSDTCVIRAISGQTTQEYNFFITGMGGGCSWVNNDINNPTGIPSYLYFSPLSYNVYSAVDSSLVTQAFSNSYQGLVAPIAFFADTIIPIYIEVRDAKGCLLAEREDILTFNVQDIVDMPYPYEIRSFFDDWRFSGCCDRYLYIKQNINASSFRQNMTVHLIESPLYNQFNFTAVCQDGMWSYTADDPSNNHTYAECSSDEDSWQVWVRDSICLAPGRYTFVVTSSCGNDTLSYVFQDNFYKDSVALDISYDMWQICDRLIVHPNVSVIWYTFHISNNNEVLISPNLGDQSKRVINGVPGGYNEYPDANGNFVFTVPGTYVIETYASACQGKFHYDTIEYVPVYIEVDRGYAILCDNLSDTGFVYVHAINGTEPYTYYLYDQPDLMGTMIGTESTGFFQDVPMTMGSQFSILAVDSCQNSFYVNLTAIPINQSALAWEYGDDVGTGHCEGDSVFLTALPFEFDVAYQWTGPNGFSSTDRVNNFVLPYGGESGYYVLEVLNTGCETQVKDSVYIAVLQGPRITILSDTTVCPGEGITLEFQAQGSGMVNFDIIHNGAPASGSHSFSTPSGSSIYQYYPIESNNMFWAANISDERCAYNHLIDTVEVVLINPITSTPPPLTTMDGYACYNQTAGVSASSSIGTPYYVRWYIDDRQTTLLQCDTINNPADQSTLFVNNVIGDTTVYVIASNATNCPSLYGSLYHVVNMQNGITTLLNGEGARLYDSGGAFGNYGDDEDLTHTFTCPGANLLEVVFNSVDIALGDTLYMYAGGTISADSLLAVMTSSLTDSTIAVHQSTVTFHFNSNWVNNQEGWSIDILTAIPMTTVSAHVTPLAYDTLAAVVCASTTPYPTPYLAPLDISQEVEYLTDTIVTTDDGCEVAFHLHLVVNPVSDSDVQDSLMPCELPFTWNGVTFNDYGTKTAVLPNMYGCDSLVTMTLHWAPPIDSTTVFDTIVENQLPYHTNGLIFDGPGTQIATLSNINGCDSIVTIHLHVFYNVYAEADSVICDSELPLVWNNVTFTQTDTLTAVLTNLHGADSILTMRVTVHPTHHTILSDTVCQRMPYNNYGFNLSASQTASSGINIFTRNLNNVFGCDSLVELQLLVTPDITPHFYPDPDKALLSENPTIQFINTTDISDIAQMNFFWIWDFGDGKQDTTSNYHFEHLYTQWGDYTVTLTLVVNDCESYFTSGVLIEADLEFPNVITPNGDGLNDVFIIKNLNPERPNQLYVANRWGKTVFDQNNYQTYMKDDIVYNAESGFGMGDIPAGVYYFTFYYVGVVKTVKYHGTITVIR